MKRLQTFSFLLLAALVLFSPQHVQGQGSGFTIENADATNSLAMTGSSQLGALLDQVAPRFAIEFANANEVYSLTAVPDALSNLLSTIQPRFVVEFANANRFYTLTPMPAQLDTLLGQIAPRFVLEFANANREIALGFPVDLIDDTTPPQGSNIEATSVGDTSATISWTTDEYADSTVKCGTQSGNYTITVSDPLYVKVHAVDLSELEPETTYYCQVSSTDQSGNTYQSQEFSFELIQESFIYLPLALRTP
jgi:hypothetical protein